ncbi:MAG TPA: acyl-CoA synthetase [Acidimicrobiales bacterium]|jgi:acyl-CoA synthetase (AMP-forming)/AMP-acid ligase II|nr:acyl-CoA synthetase [Acidimicrobiales bacterium]
MTFNLADLFENAVDAFGDREYLVVEGQRRTYADMEERANCLAHHLAKSGIGPGDHVGIYSLNSVEWVETAWAVFKLRAVWININFRYVEDELRYLFTNADLKALVHQRSFSPQVTSVLADLPDLAHIITVEDGSDAPLPTANAVAYEDALASGGPERDFGPRSSDDHYILYTGGTTGMPKGVVWRHEDVFYALGGGIDPMTNTRIERPEQLVEKGVAAGHSMTSLPIAPLMHGASQWAVMGQSFHGNRVVLVARFTPQEVWRLVGAEKVNSIMITGDAMGKPLVEALDEPGASYDLSSLYAVVSTAALFSAPVKDEFFAHLPNIVMTDAIGSSETGSNGMVMLDKDHTAMKSGPTVRAIGETVVLDEKLDLVKPGSGVTGKIARTGDIPLGYYNDPVKTDEVFITVAGTRYVMPGDFATVEADGTITLLGRGSVSINSGGEKIYPEEVESAVRSHPEVFDAIVVGAPDDRWGQRVAAIIQPRADRHPSLEDIQLHCRNAIAGYKVPRQLHVVETIVRSPSGKPDYRWANAIVAEAPEESDSGGARTAAEAG